MVASGVGVGVVVEEGRFIPSEEKSLVGVRFTSVPSPPSSGSIVFVFVVVFELATAVWLSSGVL